jgi:hypothetical protein
MSSAPESGSQTPPVEIRCNGCGRTLRLQPERVGLRQRCPVCKTLTPHPRHEQFLREWRGFAYAAGALGVLGIIPLTWPVGLYLLAISIVTLTFEWMKYRQEEKGADKSRNRWKIFAFNSSKALRDTAGAVSAGIALVCLAQLLLRTLFSYAEPPEVHGWEDWVASKRAGLAGLLQIKWMLLTLASLILVSLIWPSASPVTRYRSLRTWASRVLLALTVVSSFTFFTSNAIDAAKRDWVAQRRDQYKKNAAKVRSGRQTLANAAYCNKQLQTLSTKSRKDTADFLEAARRNSDSQRIIGDFARDVAEKMRARDTSTQDASDSVDSSQNSGSDDSPVEISLQRIEAWEPNGSGPGAASPPTFEDGVRVTEEARKYENAEKEAEASVEEVVKSVLGDQLSSLVDWDPLIKPFVKTLLGSSVKTFFPKGILRRIRNYRDADSLITLNLSPRSGIPWDLDVGKVSRYESPPSAATASTPKTADAKVPDVTPGIDDLLSPSRGLRGLPVNPGDRDFPTSPSFGGNGGLRQIEKCCEMCTYRNGILIGCVPMGCGPQCAGAH